MIKSPAHAVLLVGLACAGCSDESQPAASQDSGDDTPKLFAGTDTAAPDTPDAATEPDTPVVEGPCAGIGDGNPCDDGDACTVNTTCQDGVCGRGSAMVCDAGPCRQSTCDPAVGCVDTEVANGTPCSAPCFSEAVCQQGECIGQQPVECPAPTEPCLESLACDMATGQCTKPTHEPAGTACQNDVDACTRHECTAGGECASTGETETCADQQAADPCWTWQCMAATGCQKVTFQPGSTCDDDDPCTHTDECVTTGGGEQLCQGIQVNGDDGDPCTTDYCDGGVVEHDPTSGPACDAGPCQVGECDTGQCIATGDADDGTPCGEGMVCAAGECVLTDGCPTLSAGTDAPDDLDNGPVAFVAGASIHLVGGSPSKQHLVYTPGSGWITGVALEDGVGEGAGAQIGLRWYVVDGDEDEDIRIFDLQQGEWSTGAPRPGTAPRGPAAGTDGTYLFVAGGADGNLNGTTATDRYDPVEDEWIAMSPMPTARGVVAHAVVGDRLYVIGGRDKALAGSTVVDTTEAYDMTDDTWHELADMPSKRNSAFAAAIGDRIVVAGGFSGSTTLDLIEIYDTTTDTWQTCTATMSSAFSEGAAATLNGKVYLFGGGPDETGVEIATF